jgi:hypothetical protein
LRGPDGAIEAPWILAGHPLEPDASFRHKVLPAIAVCLGALAIEKPVRKASMTSIPEFLEMVTSIDGVSEMPVFFIGGLPRSGTTWLQQLIDAHPEVVCLGESQFMSGLSGQLGRVVANHSERRGEDAAVWAPASRGFQRGGVVRLMRVAYVELVRANIGDRDLSRTALIGEKTPENIMHLGRIYALFPKAKFIHVMRDGRDGAISAWSRFRAKLPPEMSWEEYVGWYAKEWVERNRKGLADCNPGASILVQYETLHRDTLAEATRIFEFLGVSSDSEIVAQAVSAASFEALSGGRRQGQVDPKSHYRRGEVEGWRAEFDEAALAAFESVAGDALAEWGYPSGLVSSA